MCWFGVHSGVMKRCDSAEKRRDPLESPWARAWLHLAAIVVAGAVALLIFHAVAILRDRTVPVLVVARDVDALARISSDDLATVDLVPAPGLRVIYARDRSEVVGSIAATTLAKGTILAAGDVLPAYVPSHQN